MKTLWFLLWIPALVVFYLSLHDELVRERRRQSLARTPLASKPGNSSFAVTVRFSNSCGQSSPVETRIGASPAGDPDRPGFGLRWGQLGVFKQLSAMRKRSTGVPPMMCDSMISSTSAAVTRPYQTASGYTTTVGPCSH